LKEDPLAFSDGVSTLSDLRASVCVKAPEAYARGLQDLLKYNGLFNSVQKRFPMTPEDRTMTFTWNDVYAAGGLFSSKTKSLPDANFETACIMFNLGALHAQVAKGGSVTDDEGQKKCNRHAAEISSVLQRVEGVCRGKFRGDCNTVARFGARVA